MNNYVLKIKMDESLEKRAESLEQKIKETPEEKAIKERNKKIVAGIAVGVKAYKVVDNVITAERVASASMGGNLLQAENIKRNQAIRNKLINYGVGFVGAGLLLGGAGIVAMGAGLALQLAQQAHAVSLQNRMRLDRMESDKFTSSIAQERLVRNIDGVMRR